MKKKVLIGAFLLLVLGTAITFIVGAIGSYRYDMDPANGVDILRGLDAAILIIVGGLSVLCEIDLFVTVYYFVIKPKTLPKSIFMILSQLLLLFVIFGEELAHCLSLHVSDVFKEEVISVISIFFLYVMIRSICVFVCFSQKK